MNDKDLRHLAAIVRDSDDAIMGVTLEGIITSWNAGAERIYGYTAEEAVGRAVAMLVPPDREDELSEILQKLTQGEGINHYETLRVRQDGRLVNISLTISPIHDASGAIIGVLGIGRDVTKEKEAEAALRESARAYKLLMEQASDAILVSYPDQPLIEVNQRASDMLGYTREELLQLRGEGSVLPEGLSALILRPDEILEGNVVYAERAVRRKDGTIIITELSTRQLDDGRIVTIARDITERKRAEDALRESEARLRSAIDLAQLSSYEWNPRTGALNWGMGLKEIWGLPPDTSVDIEIFLAGVHPDDRESVQAAIARCTYAASDGMFTAEYRVIGQQDKQERWVAARGKTFFDGDIAVRHVGVAQDITERKLAEEAMASERYLLNSLMESTPDSIYFKDSEGKFTHTNRALAESVGLTDPAEAIGKSDFDLFSNELARSAYNDEQEIIRTGRPILSKEEREVWADGHETWVLTTKMPLRDVQGHITGIIGVSRQITDRKKAEEALKESQAQFANIINSAMDAIIAVDSDHRIILFNGAAELMFGWSTAEVLGEPLDLLIPQRFRRVHGKHLAGFGETGFTVRAMGELGTFSGLRKDNTEFPIEASISQIEVAGRKIYNVFLRDITRRKRAEEALRTSEEKFRAIFENTLEAVFITDDEGRFVDVNHAATKLIGLSAEELVGRNYAEFQDWKDATAFGRLQGQVVERGEASGDLQFVSANGETKDIEYFSKTNFIPGYHLSVAHDLTERRRAGEERMARDAAERANRAKNEFLSRMSHELRTPLNAILGFGQLLQMDSTTPEQEESVGYIVKAGQHLLDLINEVLDIARIEDGKLSFSIEPVFVRDVLQESLNLVQPLAARQNIEVKADLAWMESLHVMADHQRLQQVLLNLLANAIKYNREGGVVNVSCSELSYEADGAEGAQQRQDSQAPQAPQSRARVRITVSDTGPGLSPDKVARLFTPFERLGAEQSDVEGTGLGLALSKHLVEAMGGAIGAESEQGVGSTFWVELSPADEQMPAHELLVTGSLLDIQLGEQARTILYIEDNLSNLRLIERILGKWPETNLITAMQGQMGLDIAYEHQPDLVLLDLHLPDMTGDEVLRRLREDPRTASIPVVVLSADANPRQVDKLLEAGAQAYLTKPLDVKQLLKVLREITARRTG